MRSRITAFMIVAAGAAFLTVNSSAPAQAGGKDAAIGFGIGTLFGLGLANRAPVYAPAPAYVAPAPVYVQPRCYWQKQKIWDPYVGAYIWRSVQVCN